MVWIRGTRSDGASKLYGSVDLSSSEAAIVSYSLTTGFQSVAIIAGGVATFHTTRVLFVYESIWIAVIL